MKLFHLKQYIISTLAKRVPADESIMLSCNVIALTRFLDAIPSTQDRELSPSECSKLRSIVDPSLFTDRDDETPAGKLFTQLFEQLENDPSLSAGSTSLSIIDEGRESRSSTYSSATMISKSLNLTATDTKTFQNAPTELKVAALIYTLFSTLITGGVALGMESVNESPNYPLAGGAGFGSGLLAGILFSYLLFIRFPPTRRLPASSALPTNLSLMAPPTGPLRNVISNNPKKQEMKEMRQRLMHSPSRSYGSSD